MGSPKSGSTSNRRRPSKSSWPWLLLGLALVLISGTGLFEFREELFGPKLEIPAWLTFDPAGKFTRSEQVEITQAAQDWDTKYSCGVNVRILRMTGYDMTTSGVNAFVPEESKRGEIKIDTSRPKMMTARNIILHAMTHACRGEARPIGPIILSEGFVLHTARGLNIEFTNPDGVEQWSSQMDEGAAEYLASAFPGYPVFLSRDYSFYKERVIATGISREEALGFIKGSDPLGFIARINDVKSNELKQAQIENTLISFLYN